LDGPTSWAAGNGIHDWVLNARIFQLVGPKLLYSNASRFGPRYMKLRPPQIDVAVGRAVPSGSAGNFGPTHILVPSCGRNWYECWSGRIFSDLISGGWSFSPTADNDQTVAALKLTTTVPSTTPRTSRIQTVPEEHFRLTYIQQCRGHRTNTLGNTNS
jgi:hypothetical protein